MNNWTGKGEITFLEQADSISKCWRTEWMVNVVSCLQVEFSEQSWFILILFFVL